jgi:hypothetical protein
MCTGRSVAMKKPVLAIYRPQEGKILSAMIRGGYRIILMHTYIRSFCFQNLMGFIWKDIGQNIFLLQNVCNVSVAFFFLNICFQRSQKVLI